MQNQYRFFDDLARLANGAVGTLAGARNEVEVLFRQRLEAAMAEMDVVPREELDVVREMARKAREENEQLLQRLEETDLGLTREAVEGRPEDLELEGLLVRPDPFVHRCMGDPDPLGVMQVAEDRPVGQLFEGEGGLERQQDLASRVDDEGPELLATATGADVLRRRDHRPMVSGGAICK